jgi:hypothetical protein
MKRKEGKGVREFISVAGGILACLEVITVQAGMIKIYTVTY